MVSILLPKSVQIMVYQYKIYTGLWGIPQITVFKYAPILDLALTVIINIKNEQV